MDISSRGLDWIPAPPGAPCASLQDLGCCARVAAGRRTVAVAAGSEASQGRVPGPLVGGDLAGLPLKLRLALAALDPAWRPLSYTVSYISIIKLDPRFRASDRPLHRTECLYLNLK